MSLFWKGLLTGALGFVAYQLASAAMTPFLATAGEDDPVLSILVLVAVMGYGLMIGGPVFLGGGADRPLPDGLGTLAPSGLSHPDPATRRARPDGSSAPSVARSPRVERPGSERRFGGEASKFTPGVQ